MQTPHNHMREQTRNKIDSIMKHRIARRRIGLWIARRLVHAGVTPGYC